MTGRRTSRPRTGLWTATVTLLLFSVSVRSQSASALNEAAPSPRAAATDSPSGSVVASLRKVDSIVESPSATSKSVGESPKSSLDAVAYGEKIVVGNSTSNKLDDPKSENERAIESGKPEELREIGRVDEKSEAAGIPQPEFNEKEDYVDTHELEEENDREPTTPPTKKTVRTKNESPEEPNKKEIEPKAGNSGESDVKDVVKTKPEVGISLADDTDVNYRKNTAKPSREEGALENDSKGSKNAPENATNVIASGEAADTQLEKDKGPKAQVEVVKNSTLPKVQRIAASSDGARDERKEPDSTDRDDNKEVPRIATADSKDLGRQKGKTGNLTVSSSEAVHEKVEDNRTLSSPKGRTISFGGSNEFVTSDNKTRDNGGGNDQGIDLTKETLQEAKISEFKPYPYVKTTANYPSNGSDGQLPLPKDRELPESTEEASALENTIGQRQQDKKFVVTEPSLVIDNSIQQFKPTYFKRSGNASRIQTGLVSGSSTTASSLDGDQSGVSMPSTASPASENNTTAYIDSLRVSNTENDVPRGKDEETKTSVDVKDTSGGLDLIGNGITEMVVGTRNNTVSMIDDFGFTRAPIASTASIARATEDTQVQNSTENIATPRDDVVTTTDVQTDSGNSMLRISPLNVTEGSTRIPSADSATSVEVSTSTLPTTSSMPNSSANSTDLEDLTTIAPEGSTNVVPRETLRPEESLTTDGSVESTTSKVEYEFVGLTESTASQRYIASSESFNDLTDDREAVSSTSSSFPELSVSSTIDSINGISTPPGFTSMDLDTTEAVTSIAESSTSDDSTTATSTLNFGVSEETTTSMDDNSDVTTLLDDSSSTGTNESPATTTEAIFLLTNVTNVPEVSTHVRENTTDTGRAVDSWSTNTPDASETLGETAENSSGILIESTESTNLSVTSEGPRIVPTWRVPNLDGTTNAPTTEDNREVEISATPQDAIDIVTEGSTVGRAAIPSLVRIVFDGNWADVCPHLPALRQSLADLLTSGLEKTVLASQIIFQKNPCSDGYAASSTSTDLSVTSLLLYVVDQNGNPDGEMTKMLPTLYSRSPIKLQVTIHSFQLVQDSDSGNAIAVVVVSCVAFICLVLLAGLLFIMRKRQTRFNYGERCRPVSLDAYSLDSVSAYNSVRRKGAARASKRSYGNPTFEDSSAIPSHPLNFAGLATFCNEQNIIAEEFAGIPQVTARIDELPPGAEVKNRYANVVPLPETRVSLMKINNDPLTEYINASYVRGPKNATKYYIACQAPIESTVTDFWRMIWEQQSKVIIMLTDLVENGVEKCAEYIPPSEVTDCHRLYGDFQVTLKKRETKEKYAISTLHLKNLENNTFREISHIWYLWPANGVQTDAAGLIAVLLEARALQRGGPGPIVVHCSPGTGRTGTLIALDLGIRQYEITRTVDVPRVVYTIRRDRAGSVQTKEQYAFIYKALNLYATKLAGGALES